jgi:hypothetical protein
MSYGAYRVLRLSFLSHSAFASVMVSAYAAVVGMLGLAGGYVADGLSAHVRGTAAKSQTSDGRKLSRVEQWLKGQTVTFQKPEIAAPQPASVSDAVIDTTGEQRPVRQAAVLAAAMDQSETAVAAIAADESTAPAQMVVAVPETAASAKPGASAIAAGKTGAGKKPPRLAAHKPNSHTAQMLAPAKRGKSQIAVATLKPMPQQRAGLPLKRLRLADSPAEIIRRSLQGMG